jgi:hypothetical protein
MLFSMARHAFRDSKVTCIHLMCPPQLQKLTTIRPSEWNVLADVRFLGLAAHPVR